MSGVVVKQTGMKTWTQDYGRFQCETYARPDMLNAVEVRVRDTMTGLAARELTAGDIGIQELRDIANTLVHKIKAKDKPMTATEIQARVQEQYGKSPALDLATKLSNTAAATIDRLFLEVMDRQLNPPLMVPDCQLAKMWSDKIMAEAAKIPSRLRPGLVPRDAGKSGLTYEKLLAVKKAFLDNEQDITTYISPAVPIRLRNPSEDDCVLGATNNGADCGPEGDEFMGEATNRVLTPEFRVSFPKVFKAEAFQEGQEPKYSIVMLFPKKMTPEMQKRFDTMKSMASAAAKAKWGDKMPKNLRSPFRDGSEKDLPGYEDVIFVSASSKVKPGLVNEDAEPMLNPEEFYPGCYAHAYVTCYAYDTAGNRGVSFGLSTIQKTKDGEAFSPRNNAQDDFAPVAGGTTGASEAVAAPEDVFKL